MEAEQPDQVVAGSVLPAVSPPAEPEAQADQAAKENLAVLEPNSDTVTADAASTAQEGVQANASGDAPAKPKFEGGRKRKVALHLAYVGEGYLGMQRNPGCKTIEGDLFDALHKSGCISDENAADFNKVHWMRAARTDKGVSAIGQVVSLKMAIEFPNLIERINAQLPSAIRVLGCTRVTNGFDARKLCDRRRYEYILPAFAFDPKACRGRKDMGDELEQAAPAVPVTPAQQDAEGAERQPTAEGPAAHAAAPEAADGRAPAAEGAAMTAEAGTSSIQPAPSADANGAAEPGKQAATGIGSQTGPPQGVAATAAAESAATASDEHLPWPREAQQIDLLPNTLAALQPAASSLPSPSPATATPASNGDAEQASNGATAPGSSAFVFNEACQERLNRILGMYVGTHNFHNFTVRMAAEDPASRRYILSFQCEPITVEGQAWVRMVVIGQSFILHQIRKMVGLAVAVMRNIAPEESIRLALDRSRYVNTPMAPELGLFLDECYFHSYNDRWGNERDERITLEGYQEVIAEFKNKRLYPHIANKDGAEQVNATWLRSLNERNHQFSLWGTAEVLRPRAEQQGGYSRQQQAAQGDDMDAEAGTSGAAAIVGSMETYGMGRGGRGGFSGKRKPDFRDQRHDVKRGRGRGRGGGRQGGPEYRGAPSAGLSRKVAQSVDAEWSD